MQIDFCIKLMYTEDNQMKVWKLVAGILSIVFFFFVMFQSCAAGLVNAIEDNGGSSGSIGVFVALLMIVGGIVSISTRKADGNGGNIALIVIFGLAAMCGFIGYGNYSDLVIWSFWCLINAIMAIVALVKNR